MGKREEKEEAGRQFHLNDIFLFLSITGGKKEGRKGGESGGYLTLLLFYPIFNPFRQGNSLLFFLSPFAATGEGEKEKKEKERGDRRHPSFTFFTTKRTDPLAAFLRWRRGGKE